MQSLSIKFKGQCVLMNYGRGNLKLCHVCCVCMSVLSCRWSGMRQGFFGEKKENVEASKKGNVGDFGRMSDF